MNYLKWSNRDGVIEECGVQVLQLVRTHCSEKFRRMAGKNLVNVLNNIKRGQEASDHYAKQIAIANARIAGQHERKH